MQSNTPMSMFSKSGYLMRLVRMLNDNTGSGNPKQAVAYEPEVSIFQRVVQRLYQYFGANFKIFTAPRSILSLFCFVNIVTTYSDTGNQIRRFPILYYETYLIPYIIPNA